ncbi:MAG TPA: hypothetical protein VNJ47_07855 [Nevskiales bacterium]|nr:hypothetical protein [Nevskiales bacterium]
MSFDIDARIENGRPALRILDADSRCVRLAWTCPCDDAPGNSAENLALQRLFRELFLLSLLDKLTAPGPSARRKPGSSACRKSLDSCFRPNDEIKSTHSLCK